MLINTLDKCLLDHAVAVGTKEGGPEILDVYLLQKLSEFNYYLKAEHHFEPDEVEALLQFSDPLTVAMECWEERTPDKGFPICDLLYEIQAYERFPLANPEGHAQQAKQLQSLKDLLGQNMSDFQAELMRMDKAEIIAQSHQITAMQDAHSFMLNTFSFLPDEVTTLLNMENPLKFVADRWPFFIDVLDLTLTDLVRTVIEDAGKEAAAKREVDATRQDAAEPAAKSPADGAFKNADKEAATTMPDQKQNLSARFETVQRKQETAVACEKPSVRKKLRAAVRKAGRHSSPADKTKGSEAR